jgi:small subunit ribosomal protein S6
VGVATLNTYEGLFIFADTLKEEELKAAIERTMAVIVKHGGSVLGVKKLGRRNFARPMAKRDSGVYVRAVFNLEPGEIAPLTARYKLNEDVFRVQITRGDSKSLEFVAKVLEDESEKKEEVTAEAAAE